MKKTFSTKADTLAMLFGELSHAKIKPLVSFQVQEWNKDRKSCLKKVTSTLEGDSFIVRSSCKKEDGSKASNAGTFLSLTNISAGDLEESIIQVIESYKEGDPLDEVLIQTMLQNVLLSGVAFSHDPNTCSPYRVVNWTESGDTTAVTGGLQGSVWHHAANSPAPPPEKLREVFMMLHELIELFEEMPLDCEFAITEEAGSRIIWLLQVRPLVLTNAPSTAKEQHNRLKLISDRIDRGIQPHPFLMGERTVYGVMPDWNPAEILGIRPKPLALSLYRELITDSIWAYQRHNYGYRNLRSFPLMPYFHGLPYIDVRLSFNSFIPYDLDEGLASRLVDYYIERLLKEPTLHDKVEFEIVLSCYTLDLPKRLQFMTDAGFSEKECESLSESLRKLTNKIVHPQNGLWRTDASKLNTLISRRDKLLNSNMGALDRIYWLLEDTKRYGTLPFAGLARVGFISIQMLKSLVSIGVFSESDYDAFLAGISTVSGKLAYDRSTLNKKDFLSRYGHLRPGTYDILSPRYDKSPELYFDWEKQVAHSEDSPSSFSVTLPQMREVTKLLESHKLDPSPVGLFDFMESGIQLREYAKFEFSRNLSDILELIADFGERHGICREDLAYSDINVFKELYISSSNPRDALLANIDMGKERYKATQSITLPPLIVCPEDVWSFQSPDVSPNFITQKETIAKVTTGKNRKKLEGALVCIPNADPGFDWLFSYPIAGLITAWGGANSHMAIRAGELGLPSVIGAGEALYRKWSNAQRLHLDCAGRRVEILT
ncbi:PEP-utilizing enzyme [Opitutales bacterium]|nr:PEP-utilizing enzyme [Opitutales bacterium]